jgi:predicted DNA-binding protein
LRLWRETLLSERTRVPQAAYFREAVEDLLKKYEEPKKKAGK